MTVYADILIITNLTVDYFLLIITAKIIRKKPVLKRILPASLLCAATTLIIFLPEQNPIAEAAIRLLFSTVICLVAFGYKNLRHLLQNSIVFLGVTFCYAGCMVALWYILKPPGMIVRNSVVYFNISPVFLIVFSVAGFLIFTLFSFLFSRRNKSAENCYVTLEFCGKSVDFSAIIDSGNSLADPFSSGSVIIADCEKCRREFGKLGADIYPQKYRAIPCTTVSGGTLLDGFRCERGVIITEDKIFKLKSPVMAISKLPLCDCEAIVNPEDCN